jgi:hypothetical protein
MTMTTTPRGAAYDSRLLMTTTFGVSQKPQHQQQQQQQQQHTVVAFFTTKTAPLLAKQDKDNDKSDEKAVLRMDELVQTVAETHELSQAESRRIVDTIVDTISDVSVFSVLVR